MYKIFEKILETLAEYSDVKHPLCIQPTYERLNILLSNKINIIIYEHLSLLKQK